MRALRYAPCGLLIAPWLSAFATLPLAAPAFATPTGLNNIPTSDVVAHGVLVLQQFTNFGDDQATVFTGGFKYGPCRNIEIGLDDNVGLSGALRAENGVAGAGGAPASIPVFQAKYRLFETKRGFAGAIGFANISGDTPEAGDWVEYFAASKTWGNARVHAGYLVQGASDGLFLGLDGPVGEKTTWRLDLIETDDGQEHLTSVGFISQLTSRFLVEAWVSFPSAGGIHDTVTIKLDYVLLGGD